MASGNMIVTLVAQTRKWSSGLQKAGRDTTSFGRIASKGIQMGAAALITMTASLTRILPALANMGAESRKADVQLKFMLENMQGISKATDDTIKRMGVYADRVSKATGIDDEQIKVVQKKLLMFKDIRKSADSMGATFDRATKAAIDLAAGGFGTMETNATKLGRMLENPVKNLNALNRAGVTFTEVEKRKIIRLQEEGRLLDAQDLVLSKIEGRVKGLAEASATPFEKLTQQFAEMGDTIGEAMLPYLDDLNEQISKWLSSPNGKRDLREIVDAFVDMAKAISAVVGFVIDLHNWWKETTKQIKAYNEQNSVFMEGGGGRGGRRYYGSGYTGPSTAPPGVVADRQPAGVVVNFNAPIDSVSAGREITRVLNDYKRANGSR